jgi:hypothetical protein
MSTNVKINLESVDETNANEFPLPEKFVMGMRCEHEDDKRDPAIGICIFISFVIISLVVAKLVFIN